MRKYLKPGKLLAAAAVLGVLFILAACSTAAGTPGTTSQTSATSSLASSGSSPAASTSTGQPVTINLIAKNIAYNLSTITVPAGANVIVNFDNQDTGLPHNFSVYTDSSATTAIFTGQVTTGPAKTTYNFTAPTKPGNYFFRCDVHPTVMTGTFIVK